MPIYVEKDYPVYTVVLDNPESRNAIDGIAAQELSDAFRNFEKDEKALVAVLWGANGTFCSGANLKVFETDHGNKINKEGDGPMGPTRMELKKPIIAAIAGYAVAGGLELALWCDLRIVEKDAILGVFCRRFGVPLIDGGTVRLPRLIGLSRALDMILTGRPVTAQEAFDWGLANHIVDTGQSRVVAEKLAKIIAEFPQICLRNDRISVYQQYGLTLKDALKNEFELGLRTLASGEYLKGGKEFIEGKGKHGLFD